MFVPNYGCSPEAEAVRITASATRLEGLQDRFPPHSILPGCPATHKHGDAMKRPVSNHSMTMLRDARRCNASVVDQQSSKSMNL
eukprot:COSAG02_NODE_62914_length_264_cov_1.236364_1_plen_83_part_10